MSTLEERLQGGSSMPWIPDPAKAAKYENPSYNEQVVIGIAVDHFTRENFNQDGEYDVLILNVEGVGDVAIHCQSTVLANQMHAARPVPGERVGVAYKGERTGSRGIAYHDYVVKVDRESGGSFAWADGRSEQVPVPEAEPDIVTEYVAPPPTPTARGYEYDDNDVPF